MNQVAPEVTQFISHGQRRTHTDQAPAGVPAGGVFFSIPSQAGFHRRAWQEGAVGLRGLHTAGLLIEDPAPRQTAAFRLHLPLRFVSESPTGTSSNVRRQLS
jgi:hypothetical protein